MNKKYYIKYGVKTVSLVKRIVTDLVGNVTDVELATSAEEALSFESKSDAEFEAAWLIRYRHPAAVWDLRRSP